MKTQHASTLLVTHTDRDGLFSGAALLRSLALAGADGPVDVLTTQGCFLAEELEEAADAGRRYGAIVLCDTYWHPDHGDRILVGLGRLRADGGEVTWIDHHPSTVADLGGPMAALGLSGRTRVQGDREGRHEAVSLVAEAFGTRQDPVVAGLLDATYGAWEWRGKPEPAGARAWLAVVDGLARCPDLPAVDAAGIVRGLATGWDTPIPGALRPLAEATAAVDARTRELAERDWPRLPSAPGGYGVFLDLADEPRANAYRVARALFDRAERRIDYFVVCEHPGVVHYVSGERARAQRDRLERGRPPSLRVSTMHKGWRGSARWRTRNGIDLSYLTVGNPGAGRVAAWIDAHPYLVKACWADGVAGDAGDRADVARDVGRRMVDVLERFGWEDADRGDACGGGRQDARMPATPREIDR